MAEATTVAYNVVFNTYGLKGVVASWGNFTTGDILTLTGYASINTAWHLRAQSPSGIVISSASIASNVITFGQTSGAGSGYVFVIGL